MSAPPAPSPGPGAALFQDPVADRLERYPLRIDTVGQTLDRIRGLLARLGDPQTRLPPVIHVAGTNGKGSTVAFLRAILEAAGLAVHVYTSPHLVRFAERIRLAGPLIDDGAFVDLLDEIDRAAGSVPFTIFEAECAAAFLAFSRQPADVVLLEVGLGGRLDATNVVPRPAVTVITRISMDHMEFLGPTLAQIAAEKAGIARPGVPLVIGPQAGPGVMAVFRRVADGLGAPLLRPGIEWSLAGGPEGLVWSGPGGRHVLPEPALAGAHQRLNAGTAVTAALALGHPAVDAAALAAGLREVAWPGRLQRLTRGPLLRDLPPDSELWLDGGHNDSAAEALAATLTAWRARDSRPIHLILGLLRTKRVADLARPLRPLVARCATVTIPEQPAARPADALAAELAALGLPAEPAPDIAAALGRVTADAGPCRVLVFGSLYLVGWILRDHA